MIYSIKGISINLIKPISVMYRATNIVGIKQQGFTVIYLNQFIRHLLKERKTVPYPGKINSNSARQAFKEKNRKNIIILQVEALDYHIIDYHVGSKYVMPYLNLLKEQSMFFQHFFSERRGGGSSDAELSSLTSLISLNTHQGFRTADFSRITPLNKVLAKEGYYCAAIHANTGRFWNRFQSYRLMGFNNFFDQEFFHGEAVGWHSKDEEFFRQTVKILNSLPQPFFAYIITMQSHWPFKNHSTNPDVFDLKGLDKVLQDYIFTMYEIDAAINFFVNQLDEYGFLKNTTLLIYGDAADVLNYPKSNKDAVYRIIPPRCHIPLFIVDADVPPLINYKAGSHVDIGPTILDILRIEEPYGWLGTSLLRPGTGKVVLNHGRPYVLVNHGNVITQDQNNENYIKFIEYSNSILDP